MSLKNNFVSISKIIISGSLFNPSNPKTIEFQSVYIYNNRIVCITDGKIDF